MRSASLAVVLVVIAACGSSHAATEHCVPDGARPPPSEDGGTTIDEVCPAVAEKLCAQWQRCACAPADGGVLDPAACRGRTAAACDAYVRAPDVVASLASGALVWKAGAADAFLARLDDATRSCDPVQVDLSLAAVGSTVWGATCTDISGPFSECADGLSCQSDFTDPSAPRFCAGDLVATAFQERGGPCFTELCAHGAVCTSDCATGAFVCGDPAPTGSACGVDLDCESHICRITPGALDGVCTDAHLRPDGAPCDTTPECRIGSACLHDELGHGTCGPALALAATCRASGECASELCRGVGTDLGCDVGCLEDPVCAASRCHDGVGSCASGGEPGATCTRHDDCRSGACHEGRCTRTALASSFGACVGTAFCFFGTCFPDECTQPACTAIIDPTGHGSFWLAPPVLAP